MPDIDVETDTDRQDLRIAVVMTGGVSLAIWISGVTLELHRLARSGRAAGDGHAEYRGVLDLLRATATVDVIAGTSAGGLNGAFLALGLVRDRDLGLLRDLWTQHGGLEQLLREPLQKAPPSLLRGDDYFLTRVRAALAELAGPVPAPADGGRRLPVELILTGTLWDGRVSSFTDDMDSAIDEVDYDATFRFTGAGLPRRPDGRAACGDLTGAAVVGELAAAARCTSSFPGAFEPHWVDVDGTAGEADGRHASAAGRANFATAQYVVDGGVLLNKPLRPALTAIYRQPADAQVRRVLAYVVPAPGERRAADPAAPAGPVSRPPVPTAPAVLLNVLTRMRSTDSVARELDEIRTRNDTAASRRRARVRFAAAMAAVAEPLSEAAWAGYQEVRVDHAARTVAGLLGSVQPTGGWSERELVDGLRRQPMPFVPAGELSAAVGRTGADWDWGQTTVERLGEMAVDLLKRAVWLAPIGSDARAAIVACRAEVHGTLAAVRRDRARLDGYWSAAPGGGTGPGPIPARRGGPTEPAANPAELDGWLAGVLAGWEAVPGDGGDTRRAVLFGQATALAGHLCRYADSIAAVCRTPNERLGPEEADRLRALHWYLLADGADTAGVLARMLRLDVVQLAFAGATEDVEQQVELVQVSARDTDRLTGVQEHHFGAFYRPSWRVNDWLHGRLDGAAQLVRLLLSPERIRQLGPAAPTLADLRALAVGPDNDPDHAFLAAEWAADEAACVAELAAATGDGPLPAALPACAQRIARRTQTGILREDLSALAAAIRSESDHPAASAAWLREYDAAGAELTAAAAWQLWQRAALVGEQRIRTEVGTDTFARTVAKTVAVTANTLRAASRPRVVGAVLGAFRGYALTVWTMIHFLTLPRVRFATQAVEIALAAGAALLAVTILVPGIPLGLTLIGVLLLLAGLTAAALRRPVGARRAGLRLLVATVLVAGGLGAHLWWEWHRAGGAAFAAAVALLVKAAVAVGVILLGLWVAGAQRRAAAPADAGHR